MECDDKNCWIHGNTRIRGQIIIGKVVSAKARKTVIVERPLIKYIRKYKRYARARAKIPAHNTPCINAKEGDIVKIGETRRISRTKSWIVCEVIKRGEE